MKFDSDPNFECMPLNRSCLLAAALVAVGPATSRAQHANHPASAARTDSSSHMRLYREALGPFTRRVTTSSPTAQAYVDQGFQLQYAFTPNNSVRSFREAQRHDSTCAMCWWGEAWALGAYLNEPMDSADAPLAVAAVERARRLAAARATPVERALIDAMATRYARVQDRATRLRLDSAYANAMARVYAAYPDDPDAGTLYAEALMLLEPRRGNWDIAKPSVQRIHEVLEGVLARDLTHPGACHLYVHGTESTTRPEKAEKCAELLGQSIPGASHINHMPSHTFNRIGRWGDAVRANIEAWHSDLRAATGQGFAIYPTHNLHMLLFAASMDGQGAIAVQAGKDFGKLVPGGAFYHALALVRFGRFDEVLELDRVPENPIFRGLWEFSRGYAHLRQGHADSAAVYLARVESAAQSLPDSVQYRGHPASDLLGVVGGILRGEALRQEKKLAEAISVLERAVAIEDSLRYDEPEPLNFSARHWLGAALLEAGRPADAERVYRASLEDHPRNGWSLFGLEQALRAQGKTVDADRARQEFERAWVRSDTWITSSRF